MKPVPPELIDGIGYLLTAVVTWIVGLLRSKEKNRAIKEEKENLQKHLQESYQTNKELKQTLNEQGKR